MEQKLFIKIIYLRVMYLQLPEKLSSTSTKYNILVYYDLKKNHLTRYG